MATRYIFAALAVVFLIAALQRWAREGRRLGPASRTWLIIGTTFTLVAAWLSMR